MERSGLRQKPVDNAAMSEILVGQVEHVTYTNEENGFTIAKVRIEGRRDLVTVVGSLMSPTPGEVLRMTGEWTRHPKYGEQFKVSQYKASVPATIEGVRIYLGSGMIKGLGPVMAQRIVDKFGEQTLDIIENKTERLAEVEGIGRKRVAMIKAAWGQQKDIRDVMIFLQSHGVSSTYANKIFRHYGHRSIAVVKQNPFRLASDIFGIGFKSADRIAAGLGFPADSPLRVAAGVLHVLNLFADEGHVYYPYEALTSECQRILDVGREVVQTALDNLADERRIVIDGSMDTGEAPMLKAKAVYLTHFHICESGIAGKLAFLRTAPRSMRPVQIDKALEWVQQRLAVRLADNQIRAVQAALTDKVLVITGGPGTGKTTIINAILQVLRRIHVRFLLAAPTGRAAKRLGETCGCPARTIHRLLEFNLVKGGFQKDDQDPLECDLLVIDEASMIDTVLMYHLLKAVPEGATLILVGDVNQLPSVGAGNVLKDVIGSGTVTVVELNEIFRQARHSRIVLNAHRINDGLLPQWTAVQAAGKTPSDFYFIQQEDPDKVLDIILELTKERIPQRFGFDPVDDIQVLTPMHRGVVGSENLNRRMQAVLNPGADGITRAERGFRNGDKVMQIKNNYDKDVFNGDVGRVARIDAIEQQVVIRFEDRELAYGVSDLDEIVLAYAISVHKSQGSEYPAVIIPVLPQHFLLLQRNLIYTAITRGRNLVVMVGTVKALAIAVKNAKPRQRYTALKQRLESTRFP